MIEQAALLDLLRELWIDREKMHDTLDSHWTGDPVLSSSDRLIEEIGPYRDDDTLLSRLRVLAVEHEWAQHTPAGLIVLDR